MSCPLKTFPLWSFNFWSTRILHWYWFVIGCFVHWRHILSVVLIKTVLQQLSEVSTCDHITDITENSSRPKTWGLATDKRTDVRSRDFMIWKINLGLWAGAWAGLWHKRVWADYEQFLRPVFSLFRGQKKIKISLKTL